MSREEILKMINTALNEAIEREVELNEDTHLIEDEIIDSLDSAMFLLKLEKTSGKEIPDVAVEENNLFKVGNLINYLMD